MTTDTPILRADILNMSMTDYETWLMGVRERQMHFRKQYEEVERAKSLAHVDILTPKLEKKLKTLRGKLDRMDVALDKIALLIQACEALRQEILDELAYAELDHPELKLKQGVDGDSEGATDIVAGCGEDT